MAPIDLMVELELNGVWTDITDYTYVRDGGVTITRGRANESGTTEPSTCSFTVNNRDGRFSPRNPTGPYYGVIGRNTPVRVSANIGAPFLTATEEYNSSVSAPDTAGTSVTGDIDIRLDMVRAKFGARALMYKYGSVGNRSYYLQHNVDDTLTFFWSPDGTALLSADSTQPVTLVRRQAIRVTLDVNNGAGGWTATFYTAPTLNGTYTQLGSAVTGSGVTSIYNGTASTVIDALADDKIFAAEVRNGIGGTVVASPTFTSQTVGATSFVDAQGNTWTLASETSISNKWVRFIGEVSSWPVAWDVDEADVWVSVEAAGVTRRLGQGASPLDSALKRELRSASNVVAYWPMEDGEGSTSFASATTNGAALVLTTASGAELPAFASYEAFRGSKPLPTIGGSVATATVPSHAAGTAIQLRFLINIPTGTVSGCSLVRFAATGSARTVELTYLSSSSGSIRLDVSGVDGSSLLSTTAGLSVDNRNAYLDLKLEQSGSDINWSLTRVDIDTDEGLFVSGTIAGATHGRVTRAVLNGTGTLGDVVIGHVHFLSAVDANPFALEKYVRGSIPETAGRRVVRLCVEEGVEYVFKYQLGPSLPEQYGELVGFTAMGPQLPLTLSELLNECADTDLGLLIEPRDTLGYTFRPRDTLYSQSPSLELSYSATSELSPVDDDSFTRNDVTVSSSSGSSARVTLDTGVLSTLAPPNGVGRYDTSFDLNLQSDTDLEAHAYWRLHLGTVDETRYPVISIELQAPDIAANPTLVTAVLALDQGDLVTISDLPSWLPPDTVRQLAQGFTEEIDTHTYRVSINCTPGSPWDVGVEGSPEFSRVDSDSTTLAEDLDTTETAVDVAIATGGALWVTTAANPSEFPFDITVGGEVMTVTACSGTSSPQTFTVTRSVNGVVKTHLTGAEVRLARPVYVGL